LVWRVMISGSTDYRRFQADAMKQRYAMRFTAFADRKRKTLTTAIEPDEELADVDAELEPAVADARSPQELAVILAGVDATFPRVTDSPPRRPKTTSITRT